MQNDEGAGSVEANPANLRHPRERAAWWAWLLIAVALIPLDTIVDGWERWKGDAGEAGDVVEESVSESSLSLAMLKLQSYPMIAARQLDPKGANTLLNELAEGLKSEREIAAFSLLENFVDHGSTHSGPLLQQWADREPDGVAKLVEEALQKGATEEQRAKLREQIGWFAELAPGPDGAAVPREAQIKTRALLVLGGVGVALLMAFCGVIIGMILLLHHWRQIRVGARRNAFVPTSPIAGVLLESFALYLAVMTLGGLVSAWLGMTVAIVTYVAAFLLPLFWPFCRGVKWSDFCRAVGLHRGQGFFREIGLGCIGYMGVMAIAVVGIGGTLVLTQIGELLNGGGGGGADSAVGPQTHPIVEWMYRGGFWQKLSCLALAAGYAPVVEEIFFRGALQRYFRRRFRFLASALLTAGIFAVLHPQGFYAIPALGAIGLGLSLLREWRDSLLASMTAHAINNGCLILLLWLML